MLHNPIASSPGNMHRCHPHAGQGGSARAAHGASRVHAAPDQSAHSRPGGECRGAGVRRPGPGGAAPSESLSFSCVAGQTDLCMARSTLVWGQHATAALCPACSAGRLVQAQSGQLPRTPACSYLAARLDSVPRLRPRLTLLYNYCSYFLQLPTKLDKIVFCELTPLQLRAYQRVDCGAAGGRSCLRARRFRRVCMV